LIDYWMFHVAKARSKSDDGYAKSSNVRPGRREVWLRVERAAGLERKQESQRIVRILARAKRDGGPPKGQRFEIGAIGENVAAIATPKSPLAPSHLPPLTPSAEPNSCSYQV